MTHVYELYIPNTPYCMCVHIHTVCMYVYTYILCSGHNYLLVRCIILGVHVFTVHSPSEFGIYSQLHTYVHTEHVCMYISMCEYCCLFYMHTVSLCAYYDIIHHLSMLCNNKNGGLLCIRTTISEDACNAF